MNTQHSVAADVQQVWKFVPLKWCEPTHRYLPAGMPWQESGVHWQLATALDRHTPRNVYLAVHLLLCSTTRWVTRLLGVQSYSTVGAAASLGTLLTTCRIVVVLTYFCQKQLSYVIVICLTYTLLPACILLMYVVTCLQGSMPLAWQYCTGWPKQVGWPCW